MSDIRGMTPERRAEIERRLRDGETIHGIAAALKVGSHTIAKIRDEAQIPRGLPRKQQASVMARHERIREMASEGYTVPQIAEAVGLTPGTVTNYVCRQKVEVTAKRATFGSKHIKPNRVMEQIAVQAETLMLGVELIDFAALDRAALPGWIRALCRARDGVGYLIRRLNKERQRDVEEQKSRALQEWGRSELEGVQRADQQDACADGGGVSAGVPAGVGDVAGPELPD